MSIKLCPKAKDGTALPPFSRLPTSGVKMMVLGLIVCFSIVVLIASQFAKESDSGIGFSLYPWAALVGIMALAPSVSLYSKRKFAFYHPLIYGMVLTIIPGFVIGPIAIMVNMHDAYAYSMISDPNLYIPLALVYVALGIAGMWLGFSLPLGRRIGKKLFGKLPAWDVSFEQIRIPAFVLIVIGELGTFSAIQAGSFGYQLSLDQSIWGQTLLSLSSLSTLAQLILWFTIFRAKRRRPAHWFCMVFLVALGILNGVLGGNKGGLFWQMVLVLTTYFLAGRKLVPRQAIIAIIIIVPIALLGVYYGNSFRILKGPEQTVSIREYLGLVSRATAESFKSDWREILAEGAEGLFRRTEITTHLAVVVSNYKRLLPIEKQYGLDNNIIKYLLTGFIPRFVWPEKPLVSDTRSLSALYFNRSDNSYAITPFGDLLRNYGPIGIPVGMALLGFILAIIYQLVASQPTNALRAGLYYALLTTVSFEGFYASIFPGMIRAGLVTGLAILFMRLFIRRPLEFFPRH